jgi:hypothetical protein
VSWYRYIALPLLVYPERSTEMQIEYNRKKKSLIVLIFQFENYHVDLDMDKEDFGMRQV